MLTLTERFKYAMVGIVLFILVVVVFCGAIELGLIVIGQLIDEPLLFLGEGDLIDVFGFIFVILIGLEIVGTVKAYIIGKHYHVKIFFQIAMLAIARQVILVDLATTDPLALFGLSSILIALTGGYYILQRAQLEKG